MEVIPIDSPQLTVSGSLRLRTEPLKGHVKYTLRFLAIILRSKEIFILFRSLEISISFPRNNIAF